MASSADDSKKQTTTICKTSTDGDICSLVGEVRAWHFIMLSVIFTNSLFNAFGQLSMAFMLPNVNFTCARDAEALEVDIPQRRWVELTQSSNFTELRMKASSGFCFRRKLASGWRDNVTDHLADSLPSGSKASENNPPDLTGQSEHISSGSKSHPLKRSENESVVKCNEWDFDHTVYRATIVEQWNLMCDNDYLRPLPQAVSMAGLIVGNIVVSHFSDRFGRRISVLCGIALCAVSGVAATTTSNFVVFNVGRLFSSVSKIGIQSTIVIFLETTDASSRWMFSMLNGCGFHFGMILLSITAYYGSSWRFLQLGIASPAIALLPFLYFVCESPRWLLSQKRLDDGVAVLRRIAKMNAVPEEKIDAQLAAIRRRYNNIRPSSNKSAFDLFRSTGPAGPAGPAGPGPSMIRITCIMWYLCFAFGILFYSAIFMSTSLGKRPHVSFCIPVAGELCAIVLLAFGVRFLRRRLIVFVTALLGAFGFLILGLVDKYLLETRKRLFLEMAAIILIRSSAAAFTQLYPVYSAELYPTPLRNVGIGFCDLMFRLASTIDPFGRYWLPRVHERLLPILYATMGS